MNEDIIISLNDVENLISEALMSKETFSKLLDTTEIAIGATTGNPISILKLILKAGSIPDKLFSNKLKMFLEDATQFPLHERIKFAEKHIMGKEKEFEIRLIEEIDAINDSNKIKLLSNAFKAMMNDDINNDDFYRVAQVIRNTLYQDLMYLRENIHYQEIDANMHVMALSNVGLMHTNQLDKEGKSTYTFIELAYMVYEYSLTYGNEKYGNNLYLENKAKPIVTKNPPATFG